MINRREELSLEQATFGKISKENFEKLEQFLFMTVTKRNKNEVANT
jgi:hypothetical protein